VKGGNSIPSSTAPSRMSLTSSNVYPSVSTVTLTKGNHNYPKFISLT
jgi:hypothetical protein